MLLTQTVLAGQIARCAEWPHRIPPDEWSIYKSVMEGAIDARVRFAIGGAFATATYAGIWRETKDFDLYVLPEDRDRMIQVVSDCGLEDYYGVLAYDRRWIYRSHRGGVIVDIIWAMANQRATADWRWFDGPEVAVDGLRVRLMAPEEALWNKLYIVQRDRCDWPDALGMVYNLGPELDWVRLWDRLGEDKPLLSALLTVFQWLSPERARDLPNWLWGEVHGVEDHMSQETMRHRVGLLDTRPWYPPTIEEYTKNRNAKGAAQC